MNYLDNIAFLALLIIGIGLFVKNIKKLIRNIKLGGPIKRNDSPKKRWANMAMVALGQSKMVKRPIAGLLHIIVYVGFIIINLSLPWEALVQLIYYQVLKKYNVRTYKFQSHNILLVPISHSFYIYFLLSTPHPVHFSRCLIFINCGSFSLSSLLCRFLLLYFFRIFIYSYDASIQEHRQIGPAILEGYDDDNRCRCQAQGPDFLCTFGEKYVSILPLV